MMPSFIDYIDKRISTYKTIHTDEYLSQEVLSVVNRLYDIINKGGKIFTIGNGGSCAQAQHFAAELIGRFGHIRRRALPAIALTSDSAVMSALSNDFGYEHCFTRQLEALASERDALIAFTTSGTSRNIIEALVYAKSIGCCVIVICGDVSAINNRESDYCLSCASNDTAVIQEFHLFLTHFICESLSELYQKTIAPFWSIVEQQIPDDVNYLILDRDGVINEKRPNQYVKSPEEFSFTPGFLENIHRISSHFKRVFVVTNQKGVGLGIMSLEDLKLVHDFMLEMISKSGCHIDSVYYSTSVDSQSLDRKPNIGMAEQIKEDYPDVDFHKTLVIGDSASDQLFATNIGAHYLQYTNE